MPRVLAQIVIQMVQPDDPTAPPQVSVQHPPDDQACGMMMWTAAKLIGQNLRQLHEDQRVRIAQALPPNGSPSGLIH